jgi:hypothetical protein
MPWWKGPTEHGKKNPKNSDNNLDLDLDTCDLVYVTTFYTYGNVCFIVIFIIHFIVPRVT